jgi:RNA polymerase sigma-70 factor (ECF subfamily)
LLKLEGLFERHGEGLYRYLVFRLGSAEDAEDVLQEVFCRFARYTVRWKLVRDTRGFVFHVARNEANRFLGRAVARREGQAMIEAGSRAGVFTAAFSPPEEPALAEILRAADGLPAEQKEAVYLKAIEGLTFKEIGSACGVPADTAASRYRYGIEKLRRALEGEK